MARTYRLTLAVVALLASAADGEQAEPRKSLTRWESSKAQDAQPTGAVELTSFAGLKRGSSVSPGWTIRTIAADPGRVGISCRHEDGHEVRFSVSTGQGGPAGRFDVGPVNVAHEKTKLDQARLEALGKALSSLLSSGAGSPDNLRKLVVERTEAAKSGSSETRPQPPRRELAAFGSLKKGEALGATGFQVDRIHISAYALSVVLVPARASGGSAGAAPRDPAKGTVELSLATGEGPGDDFGSLRVLHGPTDLPRETVREVAGALAKRLESDPAFGGDPAGFLARQLEQEARGATAERAAPPDEVLKLLATLAGSWQHGDAKDAARVRCSGRLLFGGRILEQTCDNVGSDGERSSRTVLGPGDEPGTVWASVVSLPGGHTCTGGGTASGSIAVDLTCRLRSQAQTFTQRLVLQPKGSEHLVTEMYEGERGKEKRLTSMTMERSGAGRSE